LNAYGVTFDVPFTRGTCDMPYNHAVSAVNTPNSPSVGGPYKN